MRIVALPAENLQLFIIIGRFADFNHRFTQMYTDSLAGFFHKFEDGIGTSRCQEYG